MSTIQESIDVEVPVSTVYNQWTQFEEFPKFMEGVESVKQLDDKTLHWVAKIGGTSREFDTEITEQTPDQRIAWTTRGGEVMHGGVVTFHRLDENRTRLMLQMEYDPKDWVEKAGDALGFVQRRVQGDLQRFKDFIESRGSETGAWRGEIPQRKTG